MERDAFRGLVPPPRSVADSGGTLGLGRGGLILCPPGAAAQARVLSGWLGATPGVGPMEVVEAAAGKAGGQAAAGKAGGQAAAGKAGGQAAAQAAAAGRAVIELRSGTPGLLDGAAPLPAAAADEAYRLEIGEGHAAIIATGPRGFARGAATLWQLALSEGPAIRGCAILDWPRFAWRGFMLDTARNFFSVPMIERLLDLAALHKLSVFHWHLTDDQAWRIELPSVPEAAKSGSRRRDRRFSWEVWNEGSYSPADARRIVAFAAARGIEVVPEIETPGHASALLASHPELSCRSAADPAARFEPVDQYGIFEDILCAGNDRVFDFLEKVFADLAAIFPGPWVHIGGDEAPKARWKDCPRCRARLAELLPPDGEAAAAARQEAGSAGPSKHDLESLQAWFTSRVAAILASHGKRMIGWDEILDAPEGLLPADALVMSWRGYSGGEAGARRGHGVVMCPQTKACYLDHKHLDRAEEPGQLGVCTVRDSWSFEPVPPGLAPGEAGRIAGGQGNLWSELVYFGKQAEYMAYPRLSALAESLWSGKEGHSYEEFAGRLGTHLGRLGRLGVNCYRGPLE